MGIKYFTILCLCLCGIQVAQSTISALIQQNSALILGQSTNYVCQGERTSNEVFTIAWDIGSLISGSFVSSGVNLSPYTTQIDTVLSDDDRLKIGLSLPITNTPSSPLNIATFGLYLQCTATDTNGNQEEIRLQVGPTLFTTANLGESCSSSSIICIIDNSECGGLTCTCRSGYFQFGSAQECRAEILLGLTCTPGLSLPSQQQQCQTTNAVCSSTTSRCACASGYVQSGTNCIALTGLGQSCGSCTIQFSSCQSGFCGCNSGYYAVGTTQCLPVKSLGSSCSADNQCASGSCTNGLCVSSAVLGQSCSNTVLCSVGNSGCTGVCTCNSGYYQVGGSCQPQKSTGASCSTNNECLSGTCTNGLCVTSAVLGQSCSNTVLCSVVNSGCTGVCTCNSGYYQVGGSCQPQKSTGASCSTNNECLSGTCTNGLCVTSAVLGQSCSNTVLCSVVNSGCTGVCTCNSGYYQVGGSCQPQKSTGASCSTNNECLSGTCTNGLCVTSAVLGQSCSNTVLCSVVNSGCTGVCTCNSGYYQVGGSCQPQKSTGASCSTNNECLSGTCTNGLCVTSAVLGQSCSNTALCSVGNSGCTGVCTCNSGYYQVGGSCQPQKSTGASCSTNNECLSGRCTNGLCVTSAVLDQSCSTSVLCSVINSGCAAGTCTCNSGYYQASVTSCQLQAENGATCNQAVSGSCRDSNAQCTGTCVCKTSYTLQGGVCTFQSSGSNQCPAGSQNPDTAEGGANNPAVWTPVTCYAIDVSSTQVLPCVNTRTSDTIKAARWYRVDGTTYTAVDSSTDGFINGLWDNSNLTISNALSSYSGTYVCRLCYEIDFTRCTDSANIEVIVIGNVITASAVQVADTTPRKGDQVTLTCSTTPPGSGTTFQWRRGTVLLGENTDTLTFNSIGTSDDGLYTCTATNPTTNDVVTSSAVDLDVQYVPEFSGSDTENIVTNLATSSRTISCSVTANPGVTQYRFYNASGAVVGNQQTLQVTSSMGYQRYYCIATNDVGSSQPLYFSIQQGGNAPNAAAATEGDGGISTGVIAAIVLGIIFLLLLIIIIIVCCCNYGWCRKKEKVEPETIIAPVPIVKPYIPRSLRSDQGSTVSKRDVGIMMNGHHRLAVSTDFEEAAYTPRYYLKPAVSSGPIISKFEEDYNQPRAYQLPAMDTQYLYREDPPKKKRRRRKKKRQDDNVYEPEPEPRYAETRPADDEDLVVVPGNSNYYE